MLCPISQILDISSFQRKSYLQVFIETDPQPPPMCLFCLPHNLRSEDGFPLSQAQTSKANEITGMDTQSLFYYTLSVLQCAPLPCIPQQIDPSGQCIVSQSYLPFAHRNRHRKHTPKKAKSHRLYSP